MDSTSFLSAMQVFASHIRQPYDPPNSKPFPFLKLPKELRLMIYEYLAHLHQRDEVSVPSGRNYATITLVTPLPVPPIHLTCPFIRSEASALLQTRLQQTTRMVPRIIIPAANAMRLARYDGLFEEILNWLFHVRFNKDMLPSRDMITELTTRFPSIEPEPALAAASIARLANVGGLHGQGFLRKSSRLNTPRLNSVECKIFGKLAKERVVAMGMGSVEWKLHVLVKGEGEVDMIGLLHRLAVRGKDYQTGVVVYRMQKKVEDKVYDLPGQQWVTDGGVVSGKSWLEDWE